MNNQDVVLAVDSWATLDRGGPGGFDPPMERGTSLFISAFTTVGNKIFSADRKKMSEMNPGL